MRYITAAMAVAVLLLGVLGLQTAGARTTDSQFPCSGTVTVPAGKTVVKTGSIPACAGGLQVVATVRYLVSTSDAAVRGARLERGGNLVVKLTEPDSRDVTVAFIGFKAP
jgi:hypothetical protein